MDVIHRYNGLEKHSVPGRDTHVCLAYFNPAQCVPRIKLIVDNFEAPQFIPCVRLVPMQEVVCRLCSELESEVYGQGGRWLCSVS